MKKLTAILLLAALGLGIILRHIRREWLES